MLLRPRLAPFWDKDPVQSSVDGHAVFIIGVGLTGDERLEIGPASPGNAKTIF